MNEQSPQTAPGAPGAGPATELVGQVLAGRYRILRKLGEGAMGAVYLGEHVKIGRKDAIKVLLGPLAKDPEAISRFNRGARNVSAIHHPNVCMVYDFSDTAEGLTFLAMELITGESLKDLVAREGALPPARAVEIARQTAEALQAAHDAGIVHRDLKPGNIMLMQGRDGGDVVKVVDFDIAKGTEDMETEVTRIGFVVGTPEYMSPEQLMGEKLDGRSDLYSLGLVLFRMLTGTLPFRASTPQELMVQRLTHTPLKLEEAAPGRAFPPGLQQALDRALARQADGRQASAGEFAREISAAIAGHPVAAAEPAAAGLAPTIVAPAASLTGSAPAARAPASATVQPPQATGQVAAASGQTAVPAARAPARATGGGRTLVLAGVVVVVLGAAGAIAWFVRGSSAGAKKDDRIPITSTSPTSSPATTPATPAQDVASATPATAEPQPPGGVTGQPPAGPSGSGSTAATQGGGPAAEPPKPPAQTTRTPVVTPPRLSPAKADAALWALFDEIGPPYPSAARLRAIRNEATGYWDLPGVGEKQRARAAFIVAQTYMASRDVASALRWAQRAVDHDAQNRGYNDFLSKLSNP